MSVGIAAIGNVQDINCWSNIPFFFYREGAKQGLFNQPWKIDLDKLASARKIWNLLQIIRGNRIGGFQYSKTFLDSIENQVPKEFFASPVISFNQVFPRATNIIKSGGKIYYYIDATLHDLFSEEAYGIKVPEQIKRDAISLEAENYKLAEGVVTMGTWVHHSLITHYKVPAEKIHHILPGANIDVPATYTPQPLKQGAGKTRDLVLGFVGKDWKRKGLPLLVEACEILRNKGLLIKVKVVGNCPTEYMQHPCVEYSGFVDKLQDTASFINHVSQCDIGCLFSSTEALGISTLEFLRLGVPVMGYYHQGLIDTLLPASSIRVSYGAGTKQIVEILENYIMDTDMQQRLKVAAINGMEDVTWTKTIEQFKMLLPANVI